MCSNGRMEPERLETSETFSSLKDLKGLTDEHLGSRQFMSIYDNLCQFELCVEPSRPISIWKQVPFFHGFVASFIGVTWSTSRRRMVRVRAQTRQLDSACEFGRTWNLHRICIYHLVMTNSLPWKITMLLRTVNHHKPSISMGHLYHGELLVITRGYFASILQFKNSLPWFF